MTTTSSTPKRIDPTEIINHYRASVKKLKERLKEYATALVSDPCHIQSSDRVFRDAAAIEVAEMIIYNLTPQRNQPEETVEDLIDTLQRKINVRATNPPCSTSDTANLYGRYLLVAYGEAHDLVHDMACAI
jgi:hypothetical protein